MLIRIHFDGACNNKLDKPEMGIGLAVFIDNEYHEDLSKFLRFEGNDRSSSNVAEWLGCVEAFILAHDYREEGDTVEIYSDSQLITRQFNEEYVINKDHFKDYFRLAKLWARKAGLDNLKIKWVPREQNKEADKLSKKALGKYGKIKIHKGKI